MNMLVPYPGALLQRIADALETDVVPVLPSSYQRTEVEATVLLLRNLAGRIGWQDADLAEDLTAVDELVAALAGRDPAGHAEPDFAALVRGRAELGTLIDDVYEVGAPAERLARLAAVLRATVDREELRNRAGTRLVDDAR